MRSLSTVSAMSVLILDELSKHVNCLDELSKYGNIMMKCSNMSIFLMNCLIGLDEKKKIAPEILAHIYLEVKFNFKIFRNNFFDPRQKKLFSEMFLKLNFTTK